MLIIPAIDLKDGRCVRLTQGRFDKEQIFSDDPVEVAQIWQKKGAKRLHVVDLDGAFHGEPKNIDIVKQMVKSIDIPIQLGGGIRDIETIEKYISLGIDWVIIGTSAVIDTSLVEKAVSKYSDQIIVGIDTRDGMAAIKGWLEVSELKGINLALKMQDLGVKRIIYTDVTRDGMLTSPNIENISEILDKTKVNVIASGGIASIEDLLEFKKLDQKRLEGVIVGKALYLDKIDLEEAIEVIEGEQK